MSTGTVVKSVRSYSLSEDEVVMLKDDWKATGKFPSPYKRKGPYRAIVESLSVLGVNEWHSFLNLRNKMREIMSMMVSANGNNAWDVFNNRAQRSKFTGKDLTGKIIQNAMILQRIGGQHCYGIKLKQLGASVHIKKENGVLLFKLDTGTTEPTLRLTE